jgi:hypothetical protein
MSIVEELRNGGNGNGGNGMGMGSQIKMDRNGLATVAPLDNLN